MRFQFLLKSSGECWISCLLGLAGLGLGLQYKLYLTFCDSDADSVFKHLLCLLGLSATCATQSSVWGFGCLVLEAFAMHVYRWAYPLGLRVRSQSELKDVLSSLAFPYSVHLLGGLRFLVLMAKKLGFSPSFNFLHYSCVLCEKDCLWEQDSKKRKKEKSDRE